MELHVCVVDSSHRLWHTVRRSTGRWTEFGDVRNAVLQANPGSYDPKQFDEVECAGVAGELHVCTKTSPNHSDVNHTIRAADTTWPFPFGDVRAATAGELPLPSTFESLGASEAGGDLHVCASVTRRFAGGHEPGGHEPYAQPYHTIRSSGGEKTWQVFKGIPVRTGIPLNANFENIDCAGADGQLHVCCIVQDDWRVFSSPRYVKHTIRAVTWDWPFPFGDVRTTVLRENPGSIDPGTVWSDVSCAVVAGELHVCAQSAGEVWHTVRRSDGSWSAFTSVRAAILAASPSSPNPGIFRDVSCSRVDDDLHMCFVDANGALWHTVRVKADNPWPFQFGDVVKEVLQEHPGSSDPRPIGSVATAGV